MSRISVRIALAVSVMAACASAAPLAMTTPPVTLAGLAGSAARVFRGVCVSAEVGTADYAGARIAATTYTFEVREYLKGGGRQTVSFRQVGTPHGGARDLGRAAGLPVYTPGLEYVIFLLPESRARLTSPAGASRGVLPISGDDVAVPRDLIDPARKSPGDRAGEAAAATERVPYRTVREAILGALKGAPPARR